MKNNNGGHGYLVGSDVSILSLCAIQEQNLICGSQITFADFWMFNALENLKVIDATILNDYPLLAALHDRVGARPGIAAWLKARPVTQF